ncbi:MAG: alpha-L-fucosidase [Cyclobacteriaceae bacterium]
MSLFFLGCAIQGFAQTAEAPLVNHNQPEREAWLKDAGFGMFIHFSFDSQLGVVISHSMVGASEDYLNRFINELPQTFDPDEFSPKDIAVLAKLAGMKYIVLTTKHHSGFCLWDTQTTEFNIMNTPYGKDLVTEFVEATREQGLAVGFYYSPEDFYFLHTHDQTVRRRFPEPLPDAVMDEYVAYVEAQCTELMSNYGQVDVLFFDGGEGPLQEKAKEVSWRLQPNVLVTRGAIATPEQTILGIASDKPWEACVTMGTQWQYKPTNDDYKSAAHLIEILIESRAKGGTLLLNVGPKPNGELPIEQEERLREVAAWHFINQEAVHDVRPWIISREQDIWFTHSKAGNNVYAYLTNRPDWARGERREFIIKSVQTTDQTKVTVLGQSGEVVEYDPTADGQTYFEQKEDGLHISCVRAQRIYNNHKWHNPIVLKLENVVPALEPPAVQTISSENTDGGIILSGEVLDKGDADQVEVGFFYRPYAGFAEALYTQPWQETEFTSLSEAEDFSVTLSQLKPGQEYEYQAVLRHPKIEIQGDIQRIAVPIE